MGIWAEKRGGIAARRNPRPASGIPGASLVLKDESIFKN